MKKIAVVILNWNGVQLLEKFLPSVIANSSEATIYVADNASTDTSVAFVRANFPSVKIIQNSSNFGFAKGYNKALKVVEEPIYALINSDIEVTKNWLQPILNLFEKENEVAIVQPKILDYKNKEYFEYAGAGGGFIDRLGYPFCRGRIFETVEQDLGQYNDISPIFWASGACFFIRKEVYRDLDGFDADFFAHQEEIDLCWRAFNKGYKSYYCGFSTVFHVGGATLQTGSPHKTYLNFRNSLWMLAKNLPAISIIPILFLRMILDGIAAARFVFRWQPFHFWAVIKAHFSFYFHFISCLSKRSKHQKKNYFITNSIVFDYFIRKKKDFGCIF